MKSFLATVATFSGSALAATFTVTLGIDQTTGQVGAGFDPNRIVPAVGDTIVFNWAIPSYITNPTTGTHSATQGSFGSPCQPLAGGFDSGSHTTVPESAGGATTQTFQVTTTDPLYFYSNVDNQCQSGMVLGVNSPATGDGSVESYAAAAAALGGGASSSPSSASQSAAASAVPSNTTSTTSASSGAVNQATSVSHSASSGTAPSASASRAASGAEKVVIGSLGAAGAALAMAAAFAF